VKGPQLNAGGFAFWGALMNGKYCGPSEPDADDKKKGMKKPNPFAKGFSKKGMAGKK
jgi:hypothetical protein